MFARSICALCVAVVATVPVAASAADSNPAAASLALAIGTWNCVATMPKGTSTRQIVWSAFGDGWIRGTSNVAAGMRPAHQEEFAMGYDTQAKQWITTYFDSLGAYGVIKSPDSPTATAITFTDAYPVDPNDGPEVVTLGATTTTVDAKYTMNGQAATIHEVCTKQ